MSITKNALLGKRVVDNHLYDHRYVYVQNGKGNVTCGLAREAMVLGFRFHGADIFLTDEWREGLRRWKDNPQVLGFYVEHLCLSSIGQKGLSICGFKLGPMEIVLFDDEFPVYDTTKPLVLYIPTRSTFKAIDGLVLNCEETRAHLVPIQITINKRHLDFEGGFFSNWNRWNKGLEKHEVKATFLWICEEVSYSKKKESRR